MDAYHFTTHVSNGRKFVLAQPNGTACSGLLTKFY